MFIKISEQPSLYNDLEKKSVHEILVDINWEPVNKKRWQPSAAAASTASRA